MRSTLLINCIILVLGNIANAQISGPSLIDKKATRETQALFLNLKEISTTNILFGHQHATEYGHGWYGDYDRSDVKSVTGSHPAVIGVDFAGLSGLPDSIIEKNKKALQKTITETYDRGGITTVSWHMSNPVSPGGFYWNDSVSLPAVKYILPGKPDHLKYKAILSTVASLAQSVKGRNGTLAPMIFRPFHELDGDWFWWGRSHCSSEELKALWRFTVTYLRDSLGVRNFIYAFSPDCRFNSEGEFLERYPGDDWVDMVGMDDYADFGRDGRYNVEAGIRKLQIISNYAQKSGKLAAFTETGLESVPNTTWWTSVLLPALKTKGLQLSYVLVWRNDVRSPTHYYAPFPGQPSAPDFIHFYEDPFTLFEKDLPAIYSRK